MPSKMEVDKKFHKHQDIVKKRDYICELIMKIDRGM